jgi:hypothetical protein
MKSKKQEGYWKDSIMDEEPNGFGVFLETQRTEEHNELIEMEDEIETILD